MERICERCGSAFNIPAAWVRKGNGRFCSQSCYAAHQREHPHGGLGVPARPRVEHTCARCGKPYLVPAGRPTRGFCSIACRKLAKGVMVTCASCGTEFHEYVSSYARGRGRRYCKTCHPSKPRTVTTVPIPCARCGRLFRPSRGNRRHCSEVCRRPPHLFACAECGKKVRATPKEIGRRRFCSVECYMRHTGETEPETNARLCLAQLGIGFLQEHTLTGWPAPVDFYLPTLNTALEIDGVYWHSSKRAASQDRRKTLALQVMGYRVVRLPDTPFYGPVTEAMIAYVRAALDLADHAVAQPEVAGLYPIQLALPLHEERVV